MVSDNFKKEIRAALKIVWIIYSALALIVILITVFSAGALHEISPVCLSKSLYGEECFMCGMTRAFVEISAGNFYNAGILNKLSLYLFSFMTLNSVIFIFYVSGKLRSFFIRKISVTNFQNKKLFQN